MRYYITDRIAAGGEVALLGYIQEALRTRVERIQIREKDINARELVALTERVLQLPNPHAARILINTRADIALAFGAHGVHLPSNAISPARIKTITPLLEVAVSCHSLKDVVRAESEGADFVVLGPIFETPSKAPFGPPLGLEILAQAAKAVRIPVLALGGIREDRIAQCVDSGASGIAGITLFQSVRYTRNQFGVTGA